MKKMISFYKFLTIFILSFFAFSGFSIDVNTEAGLSSAISDPSQALIVFTGNISNSLITLFPINASISFVFEDNTRTITGGPNRFELQTSGPGGSYVRGFFVGGKNAAATGVITIRDMTIRGAQARGGNSNFGGGGAGLGGALFVGENTNVTVKNVKFIDCQATGGRTDIGIGPVGGGGLGGAGGLGATGAGGGGGFIYDGGGGDGGSTAGGGGGGPGSVGQNGNAGFGGDGGDNLGGLPGAIGDGVTSVNGGGGSGADTFSGAGGDGDYGGGGGGGETGDGGTSGFGGGGGASVNANGGAGGFGGGGGFSLLTAGIGGFGGGGGSGAFSGSIGGFGGGNGETGGTLYGGGGGAMGGAIFIQTGGELTIEDYVEFSGSIYTAGVGGAGNNGSALGRDIFMMSGGSLIFDLSQNSEVQYAIDSNIGVGGGVVTNGVLTKKGAASLTLKGINTYTGSTTIENGTFILNGSIITPVTITGGTFKGNATITKDPSGPTTFLTNTSGIVAPGTSIGIINVAGDFTQGSAGTLEIEIDQSGASDLLAVTGDVDLAGTLSILPLSLPEFFQEGQEFTFMTFTGTRSGSLSPVIDPEPHLDFDIRYDSQQVVIIISKSVLLLPYFSNPNVEAVAEYLLTCDYTNADLNNVFLNLIGQTEDAILQISPVRFGALKFTNFTNDQIVSKMLSDHLRKLYRCKEECNACYGQENDALCITPNTFEVWFEPFTYFTHQSISEGLDLRPFKNKVFGGVIGGDYNFSNRMNLGGAVGYSYADIDWKGNLGGADINSVYGAVYASYYNKLKRFINASIMGTGNFYDVKRKIRFNDIDRTAKNNHKGFDITAHLGCGYDYLMKNNFYFQPTVDVDYTYDYQQSYKEKGADSLNLIVDATNFSNIRAVGLLNFIKDLKYTCICLSPAVRIGYAYEDELSSARIKSRLDVDSICSANQFSVKTYHRGHSKGIVGANITGIRTNGFTFYLNYQFEIGRSFHQNLAAARFEWNF